MSLLFALDFWKVPPTSTSKIPIKPRVVGLILPGFLLWFA